MKKVLATAAFAGVISVGLFAGSHAHAATPNASLNLELEQTINRPDATWNQTQAVVYGHTIYTPSTSGVKVMATNVDNQSVKWTFDPGDSDQIYSMNAINGTLYIRTTHSLYAIQDNQTQATLLWKNSNSYGSLALDGNTLFAYQGNSVVAMDPSTLTVKWQYTIPNMVTTETGFTFGDGKVFFVGNNRQTMENNVYALDENTGQVQWTSNMAEVQSKLNFAGGHLFVGNVANMVVLNPTDGSLVKQWATDQNSTYSVDDQHLVIKSNQGNLASYNVQTLAQEWKSTFSDKAQGMSVTSSNGPLLLSTQYAVLENDGLIKWFDLTNGSLARTIQNGAIKMQLVSLDDNLLVTKDSNSNYYVYEPAAETTPPTLTLGFWTHRMSALDGGGDSFQFNIGQDSTVTLYIKDQTGKVVRTYNYGLQNKGWVSEVWDGKDSQGQPVPEGSYTYVFHVTDLAGNENWLEDPTQKTVVGAVSGTTVGTTNVLSASDPSQVVTTIDAGTQVTITDENATYYTVNFYQGTNNISGLILKSQLSTSYHPVTAPTSQTGSANSGTGTSSSAGTTSTSTTIYTVASGDTLWKIASSQGTTVQALVDANHLDVNGYLSVGQQLVIPTANSGTSTAPSESATQTKTYIVKSGDTLWKIASNNGVTVQQLVDANQLDPTQYLSVGQSLVIPSTTSATTTAPATLKTYTVVAGDTLWKIASTHGTTVQTLIDLNHLDANGYLSIGQQIVLPN